MIIAVDSCDGFSNRFYEQFSKEGVALDCLSEADFKSWLQYVPEQELWSVEAFLLSEADAVSSLSNIVRSKSNAPLLALSNTETLQETLDFFALGVDDVVKKSVEVKEIIARIAAITRRRNGSLRTKEAVFIAGEIQIFNDGRDPRIKGEDFVLPRRERRILEYLVANKNMRVTKTQLFNAIYGIFEADVDENVIESHISKLRKKLKHKFGYDVIDSKRFLGYRLNLSK